MNARRHPMITAAIVAAVLLGLTGTASAVVKSRAAASARDASVASPAAPSVAPPPASAPTAAAASSAATAEAARKATSDAVVTAAENAAAALDKAGANIQYGAAVLDRTTGQIRATAGSTTPFYAASVVKLYTVVAILHRVETGDVTLDDSTTDEIQRALSRSDDGAMDALWSNFGGPDTVSEAIALAGLKDSAPPDDPSQWGEATLSARDVIALYDYVLTSMSPSSRELIMNDLLDAQDTGADGFNQAFGLLALPRAPATAAKQGWMWYGSDLYLHSTGAFGPGERYVVAVLTKNPASAGQSAAETTVTKATVGIRAALGV